MSSATNNILYHMVGFGAPMDHEANFDTLCKILGSMEVRPSRLRSRPDLSPTGISILVDKQKGLSKGEPIQQTAVCFCDIPLDQLNKIHARKYGCFGVGVDRETFAEFGGRPVIYVPQVRRNPTCYWNEFPDDVKSASSDLRRFFRPPEAFNARSRAIGESAKTGQDAVDAAMSILEKEFLAYMKCFNVDLPDDDPDNYYMEREWRKLGRLRLEIPLRQVVVAKGFRERLVKQFPLLACPVEELSPN